MSVSSSSVVVIGCFPPSPPAALGGHYVALEHRGEGLGANSPRTSVVRGCWLPEGSRAGALAPALAASWRRAARGGGEVVSVGLGDGVVAPNGEEGT